MNDADGIASAPSDHFSLIGAEIANGLKAGIAANADEADSPESVVITAEGHLTLPPLRM